MQFIWKQLFYSRLRWVAFIRVAWAWLFSIGIYLAIVTNSTTVGAKSVQTIIQSDLENPRIVSLDGEWKFFAGCLQPDDVNSPTLDDRDWQSIIVPNNWFLQGRDLAGEVWYRRHFQIDSANKNKLIQLNFEGVDYFADVWINGHHIGLHEGYFQPFNFLVSKYINDGVDNILVVKVNSPVEEPGKVWSFHKRIIKGVLTHHDTRPGGAWSVQGQDRNTGGIWAPVSLKITDRVVITQQQITPILDANFKNAVARIDLTINNSSSNLEAVRLSFQLKPSNFSDAPDPPIILTKILTPGINRITIDRPKSNPHLWWTWEHGKPDLYELTTQIFSENKLLDRSSSIFGFRTVRRNRQSQAWELNGQRIFMRGTNYISSQWLSEMTRDKYSIDLKLMKQANINSIRVHAHIEADKFYSLCDEMGILVWQDFPLQWSYSDAPEFIAEATRQANDMVTMLYNHPAIFAWSIHNEPPWDAKWMKYKYPDYNPNQNRLLDETIYRSLLPRDPTRYLHLASITDEHPWFGWYSGTWQDYGKRTKQPLITEFGAQALPNKISLAKIFTSSELFPDTPAKLEKWQYHNFQPHETFDLAKVPMGKTIEEFIDNTQQYQAQLVQFAAEAYRRQRYQPVSAIFQFMFVENWPSLNWGIVDYWRETKPGYESLRRAYQPILPSIVIIKKQWKVSEFIPIDLWIINDLLRSIPKATLTYTLRRSETIVEQNSIDVAIEPDSGRSAHKFILTNLSPGTYKLIAQVKDLQGSVLGENSVELAVMN